MTNNSSMFADNTSFVYYFINNNNYYKICWDKYKCVEKISTKN